MTDVPIVAHNPAWCKAFDAVKREIQNSVACVLRFFFRVKLKVMKTSVALDIDQMQQGWIQKIIEGVARTAPIRPEGILSGCVMQYFTIIPEPYTTFLVWGWFIVEGSCNTIRRPVKVGSL